MKVLASPYSVNEADVVDALGTLVADAIEYSPTNAEIEDTADEYFNPAARQLVWLLREGKDVFTVRDFMCSPAMKSDPTKVTCTLDFLLAVEAVTVEDDGDGLYPAVYQIDLTRKAAEV